MTDLYNGTLADLLNNGYRYNPEVQAFAYALQMEKQRLMAEADKTRTLAMIEQLPEPILDVLAVELRSPYYTGDMTIEQKRDVISQTLVWYYHAGTPAAIAELASVIFGSGQVVEWFDFDPNDGEIVPGEFDVETGAAMQDPLEYMDQINRIINRVKNTRSHLRSVRFLRFVDVTERMSSLPIHYAVNTVRNVIDTSQDVRASPRMSSLPIHYAVNTVRNVIDTSQDVRASPAISATFVQTVPTVTIRATSTS